MNWGDIFRKPSKWTRRMSLFHAFTPFRAEITSVVTCGVAPGIMSANIA